MVNITKFSPLQTSNFNPLYYYIIMSMYEDRAYRQLPIYKKAGEIIQTTSALIESFEEKDLADPIKGLMIENAMTMQAKIVNAEAGDFYSHRMDNAVLIKLAARELRSQTYLCEAMELTCRDYLNILREEIEEFRVLYLSWVKSFDVANDIKDEWSID